MFANGLEKNPDLLRLGQKLIILPVRRHPAHRRTEGHAG